VILVEVHHHGAGGSSYRLRTMYDAVTRVLFKGYVVFPSGRGNGCDFIAQTEPRSHGVMDGSQKADQALQSSWSVVGGYCLNIY